MAFELPVKSWLCWFFRSNVALMNREIAHGQQTKTIRGNRACGSKSARARSLFNTNL